MLRTPRQRLPLAWHWLWYPGSSGAGPAYASPAVAAIRLPPQAWPRKEEAWMGKAPLVPPTQAREHAAAAPRHPGHSLGLAWQAALHLSCSAELHVRRMSGRKPGWAFDLPI